jgi:hypothetical protein
MSVENYASNPSGGHTGDTGAIGNPGGSIQEAMESSRNRLSAAYGALQSRSSDVLEGAEGFIQNRPFQAVIYAASIGAVIGFVAGLMLGGERSNSSWHRRWW